MEVTPKDSALQWPDPREPTRDCRVTTAGSNTHIFIMFYKKILVTYIFAVGVTSF